MNALLLLVGLFLLGGGKKKEPSGEPGTKPVHDEEAHTSPPGVKIPPGGLKPAPVVHEEEEAPYAAPAPAPVPGPAAYVPPPVVQPSAPVQPSVPVGPLQRAASAMLAVLTNRMNDGSSRGAYRVEDVNLYKDFQRQARVNTDGYPGKGTMSLLKGALTSMGLTLPPGLVIYPWTTAGGFRHPNAPTMAEWNPNAAAPAPPRAAPVAPSSPSQGTVPQAAYTPSGGFTVPSSSTPVIATTPVQAAAVAMLNALQNRMNDGTGHGGYRKKDMAIYKAFQGAAGVNTDGYPGAGTMGKLSATLSDLGSNIPAGLPVYKWTAYDGKTGPKAADWNA